MPSPQVHMILDCSARSAGLIADYAASLEGRVRVISNDRELARELACLSCDATLLEELMPLDSPPDLAAYESASRFLQQLSGALTGCCYRGVPMFAPVEEWLFNTLVFLEKGLRAINDLEATHNHVVIALLAYGHSYLALWDLAARDGRLAPNDVCLSARHGGLSPWAEFGERRIEDRLAKMKSELDLRALLEARPRTPRAVGGPPRSKQSADASHVTTLFFLRTNEYVLYLKPVFPVLEEFRSQSTPFSVLTVDSLVVDNLNRLGVDSVLLHELGDDSGDPPHRRLLHDDAIRRLDQALQVAATELEPTFPIGAAAVRYCSGDEFQRTVMECLRLVDGVIEEIRKHRPRSMMVMPDAISTAHTVNATAARCGVPTITTLAASISPNARHMGVYSSDLIALAGQDDLDVFLATGYDPSRLVLTGSPMFDRIALASKPHDHAYVFERLPLEASRRTVLVASSRVDPNEPAWIHAFAEAARRRGDVQIVVKGHPNFPLERYADTVKLCAGLPVHFVRDIDLSPLLNVASAVVTDYSHAGKEALLFGKPLIVVNTTGVPYAANRYDELGVAVGVTRLDQVGPALDSVLDDQDLLARLEKARADVVVPRYNHLNDGHASERLFSLLASGARRAPAATAGRP